jgi:hypothetical protein
MSDMHKRSLFGCLWAGIALTAVEAIVRLRK